VTVSTASNDAETAGALGGGKVELADVNGDDLAQAADVIVSDGLIQTISLRREVENRRCRTACLKPFLTSNQKNQIQSIYCQATAKLHHEMNNATIR